ncbi:MAG: glycolate oxidase subunit GlcF [Alphaproteobacteria bacterium]|nr:glycolate oxidase subunit GlcF [Alphaproteobacteria bacterium]
MRYNFTPEQIADPQMGPAAQAVRSCVHCGFCTATCPTYVELGDERDSPRGRIILMKDMLEKGGAPTPEQVYHIDRCLSCLNCKTACPSSVNYQRLVDHARAHIQDHYQRPLFERALRWTIAKVMTRPALVRVGLLMARLGAPVARLLPGRLGAMAKMGLIARPSGPEPTHFPKPVLGPATVIQRIAIMPGCVQGALAPQIDSAVGRVLARRGIELVALEGSGCCGALPHHMGREDDSRAWAKKAITAYEAGTYDGVLITATGCSAQLKDIAQQFAGDPVWEPRAKAFAAASRDFLDLCTPMAAAPPRAFRVAYHPACSLQNSLKLNGLSEKLLEAAGFMIVPFLESHLCCGSAGTYSILQPELSGRLRRRKLGNILASNPDVLASGNIGCLQHLAAGEGDLPPILHIAELLDWAEGGPVPPALAASNLNL